MEKKHLNFWDYDRDAEITCPDCGWTGCGADNEELYQELLDVKCPQCDRMLLIVSFPTSEETRAAAAAGHERAQAELPNVDEREAFLDRADRLELKSADQLPDLEGDRLVIDWDFDERDDERWTVLRYKEREIWRELAYWEGYKRFAAVFALLQKKYAARLAQVRPAPASEIYLYGDKLSAPDTVDRLNASLQED